MAIHNVYAQSLPAMNGRVRGYIDFLDENGQVDRDDNGDPIITRIDRVEPNNWRVFFQRNGYEENFLINPRKRSNPNGIVDPIRRTWEFDDGYNRPDPIRKKLSQDDSGNPKAERRYRSMVESILDGET